jgi:hypothetical protein
VRVQKSARSTVSLILNRAAGSRAMRGQVIEHGILDRRVRIALRGMLLVVAGSPDELFQTCIGSFSDLSYGRLVEPE